MKEGRAEGVDTNVPGRAKERREGATHQARKKQPDSKGTKHNSHHLTHFHATKPYTSHHTNMPNSSDYSVRWTDILSKMSSILIVIVAATAVSAYPRPAADPYPVAYPNPYPAPYPAARPAPVPLPGPRPQINRQQVSDSAIESALLDRRYLQRQLKCALGEAPCDPVGRRLKTLAPLVLRGSCPQCTPSETRQIQKVLSHIQRNYPREWGKLVREYAG